MNKTLYGWLLATLTGASVVSVLQACGDDSDTSENGSSTTTTTTTSTNASTGAGMNTCQMGINTPCEMCASTECTDLALACAEVSECDASGEPTGGCLALITCAALSCDPPDDALCVASMCADELESAGGPSGEGTAAAQELGGCVQMNCDMECSQGGGGGAGGGG
ncbi:MAG TPA: hypothetical protein VFB62_22630 [Polyangiaceae bacterium]|jgi:hypothetical protein|nr:hypothetical protein [Polyangiaceae bacterium]